MLKFFFSCFLARSPAISSYITIQSFWNEHFTRSLTHHRQLASIEIVLKKTLVGNSFSKMVPSTIRYWLAVLRYLYRITSWNRVSASQQQSAVTVVNLSIKAIIPDCLHLVPLNSAAMPGETACYAAQMNVERKSLVTGKESEKNLQLKSPI